jgi:release factor glutamine methyltransferase
MPPALVLDLCTGSGAVAVSLKHERPDLAVYASDLSPEALALARINAERLLPALPGTPPLCFIESDLFSSFAEAPAFGLIVSNPPYVASALLPLLAPEVLREPRLALDGGEDGLTLIRRIIAEAPDHLLPGGALLLEADPGQMGRIAALLAERGFGEIQTRRDLAGRERVIAGRIP